MANLTGLYPADNLLFIGKFIFLALVYLFIACLALSGRGTQKKAWRKKAHGVYLAIQSGAEALDAGSDHIFPINGSLSLGRSHANDIEIHDATASGSHCCIEEKSGTLVLADLGSKNGTFVNGRKIEGTVELREGDTIQIGMVTLTVRGESQS